ncbi:MAG: sigma-54-dependent Fis family transcriptional regulator [Myxococcales bacterium]|nr:sigma-54-dependent Fis family transcriptional regulator [Myxococcales bacterium]
MRRACARVLLTAGDEALTASSFAEAATLLSGRDPFVLVADAELTLDAAGSAPALLERATAILMSSGADAPRLEGAASSIAFALLERNEGAPLGLALMVARAKQEIARAGAADRRDTGRVVASSRAMRGILARIGSFADASTSVLVTGEPGTGKRTVARLVHDRGLRRDRPFITLGVLEHEPESVVGALLEALAEAGRGTLLIDRVDALSPSARERLAALLRGDRAARVVATALPSFRNEKDGGSRELYMRLSTHSLELVPLAARPDDIAVLAQIFARRAAERLGLAPRRISAEALRVLRGAPWEGNIPELEARVEAAVALGGSGSIAMGELGFARDKRDPSEKVDGVEPYAEAKERWLRELDERYVESVLAFSGGNVTRAAHLAGMDRANFRRLVKRIRSRR